MNPWKAVFGRTEQEYEAAAKALIEQQQLAAERMGKSLVDAQAVWHIQQANITSNHTVPSASSVLGIYPGAVIPIDNSAVAIQKVVAVPEPLNEDVIPGVVVGFRAWTMPLFGKRWLTSMCRHDPWEPCKRFEAECENAPCQGLECSCGIYAYKQAEDFFREWAEELNARRRLSNHVFGEVSLWGRVLECERGYRAEYAYPKNFVDTGTFARIAAEVYKVPLTKMVLGG